MNFAWVKKLIRSEFDISFKKKEEKYMVYKDENSGDGFSAWLYSNSFKGSKFNSLLMTSLI